VPPFPVQAVSNPAQGVNPFAHIHNVINSNNNYAGRASDAVSLLSSMSAGLAPALPGQVGPTIEQLLDRRSREWKPYHNAAEFKEALQDWFGSILRAHPTDPDRQRAAHEYVTETISFSEKVGWQKAYEYHKAAFKAAAKTPPQYDPLRHGPIFQFGYLTLVHPHLPQPRRFYGRGESAARANQQQQQQASNNSNKRPRSTQCSVHPNSNHTNADCLTQQARKRHAGSSGTNPAVSAEPTT
jgi:hypothetical protein